MVVIGGGVKCWGRNDDGQLGIGGFTTQTRPVDVNLGPGVYVCCLRGICAVHLHLHVLALNNFGGKSGMKFSSASGQWIT